MISKKISTIIFFLFAFTLASAQHIAMTIEDAEKKGLSIPQLDEIYKSAVHVDSSKAVFKTETEQRLMGESYKMLLQDLGKFLSANDFKWDRPTRGFNRIYFNADGTIDYFLYNFQTKNLIPEEQLSEEKISEFNRLLNLFIQNYKIPLTAKEKFAQCSPTTYMPKEEK